MAVNMSSYPANVKNKTEEQMLQEYTPQIAQQFKTYKWFMDGLNKQQEVKELEENKTIKVQEIMKVFSGVPKTTFNVKVQNQTKLHRELYRYNDIAKQA